MAFTHSQTELKLAVARTLEASYSTDQELTARLFREAGPLKISIDQNGNAFLNGSAGSVTFSVAETMRELGMRIRMVEISMHVDVSTRRGEFITPPASLSCAHSAS